MGSIAFSAQLMWRFRATGVASEAAVARSLKGSPSGIRIVAEALINPTFLP
jgi:hypothetical protein